MQKHAKASKSTQKLANACKFITRRFTADVQYQDTSTGMGRCKDRGMCWSHGLFGIMRSAPPSSAWPRQHPGVHRTPGGATPPWFKLLLRNTRAAPFRFARRFDDLASSLTQHMTTASLNRTISAFPYHILSTMCAFTCMHPIYTHTSLYI